MADDLTTILRQELVQFAQSLGVTATPALRTAIAARITILRTRMRTADPPILIEVQRVRRKSDGKAGVITGGAVTNNFRSGRVLVRFSDGTFEYLDAVDVEGR